MRVSIVIPIYNVEQDIANCLNSVTSQIMRNDIECILVDDCGSDKSMLIAKNIVDNYSGPIKFSIIHHTQNKGLSGARNSGIKVAKGDYVYFLDSDDTITEDCISSLCELAKKYPDIECVFAGANVSKPQIHTWLDYTKKKLPEYSTNKDWIQEGMLQRVKFGMTAWNKLVSLAFLKKYNLFFEEGYIHEDELWNLKMSQYLSKAAFLKKNTYNYQIREKSIATVTQDNDALFLQRHFRLWKKMLNIIEEPNVGAQSYCVFLFSKEAYSKQLKLEDWRNLTIISINAFMIADGIYRVNIIFKYIIWNIIYVFRFLKKCIH